MLTKDERINWYRMFVDLERNGSNLEAVSRLVSIPRTTLHGYKQQTCRPKFEEAARIINCWCEKCGKEPNDIPVYNIFKPFAEVVPFNHKNLDEAKENLK